MSDSASPGSDAPRSASPARRSRFRLAAIAVLLFGIGVAIGYVARNATYPVAIDPSVVAAVPTTTLPSTRATPTGPVASAPTASPGPTSRPTSPIAAGPPPAVRPPRVGLGRRLAWTGIELVVDWSTPSQGSGDTRYELDLARDAGSYHGVDLPSASATSATVSATANHAYDFRLRARTPDGRAGPYATTAVRLDRIEESAPAVDWSSAWRPTDRVDFSGSRARSASLAGAWMTLDFDGTGVAIVGPTGPDQGKADVLIDGRRVGRIDAKASDFRPVELLFAVDALPAGPHTLTIRVADTPGRPAVTVDRFLVLRET